MAPERRGRGDPPEAGGGHREGRPGGAAIALIPPRARASAALLALALPAGAQDPSARWRDLLRFHPEDSFAQYACVTALRRAEKSEEEIRRALPASLRDRIGIRSRASDLYSLTTGAVALQESLQFDRLLGTPGWGTDGAASIDLETLQPPQLVEHPIEEPKGEVAVEPLALAVPADFAYARFRSVDALARFLEEAERWGGALLPVHAVTARDSGTRARMEEMLGLRIEETLRPLYGIAVREMALAASDLYGREGTDLTVVFHLRDAGLFEERMRRTEERLRREHPQSREEVVEGPEGIEVRSLLAPDRSVSRFRAARGELAFVSNSLPALERVLRAGRGEAALGAAREFRYMRSLFPAGDPEEDGFVYLSDPFLRRLVGPALRIAEARRVRCVNALRMIANARLLRRIEAGGEAGLESLISEGYLHREDLRCPSGGSYDEAPACSVHGNLRFLTPCLEVPVGKVTKAEAGEYREFAREYDRLWRRYYDPAAIRISVRGGLRVEVCVLPLAENSLYRALRRTAGGEPVDLPVEPPEGAVFTLALKVGDPGSWVPDRVDAILQREHGLDARAALRRAFRGAPALHLFDAPLLFDYDLSEFFGEAAAWEEGQDISLAPLLAAINLPAGLVLPVADREAARALLEDLEAALAREAARVPGGRFAFRWEGYRLPGEPEVRVAAVEFFAFRARIFHLLEEDRLLLATREEVLRALRDAPRPGRSVRANVAVRILPEHWARIRPDMLLSYEEGARRACLRNLPPLGALASAFDREPEALEAEGRRLFGEWFHCPDGGGYRRGEGEAGVACAIHGCSRAPRQARSPAAGSALAEALERVRSAEVALSFTREGLRARLEIR